MQGGKGLALSSLMHMCPLTIQVRLPRERILDSCVQVMRDMATSSTVLEFEFANEVGDSRKQARVGGLGWVGVFGEWGRVRVFVCLCVRENGALISLPSSKS